MDPQAITRCGCEARIKVHIEQFCDNHNNPMLDARFRGLMRSHRAVKEDDLHQINSMRKAGLRSGGFETVGFEIKDIYNAIEKQRRAGATDAEVALKFLATLRTTDCGMFWKYSLDGEKRLENLFWCDGTSRYDYNVFGDVLGVNHHMRTVVFGCAILSNESEESYVLLLRSFLEAMKGKQPKSVMTDGGLAMKSAVIIVFPSAHHKLWKILHRIEDNVEFAATVYTREVFELFWEVLMLARNVRVVSTKRTSACVLFEVTMYCKQQSWAVSWAEEDGEFNCSCQCMESFGLSCVHMVGVLVYLNMIAIPRSLILDRCTKRAKQPSAASNEVRVGEILDTAYRSMHAAMLDDCRELVNLSCRFFEDYLDVKTRLARERQSLQDKHHQRLGFDEEVSRVSVWDPQRARYKGCRRRVVTFRGKFCRVQRCRLCGKAGHNSCKCHESCMGENIGSCEAAAAYESMVAGEGGEDYFDFE
ncbi:hypothetical protein AHAS_Ahas17G0112800 [Arachis hypogaea]